MSTLNHDAITFNAFHHINQLDKSFIGTPDYMGIAYFWAYAYRHYLRDTTDYRRQLTHKRLLNAGLDPSGESPAHERIIERTTRGHIRM